MEKTNRKAIPFNFELWGKEGISVDDTMGRLIVKLHEHPMKDEFYGVTHDGCTFALPANKFIMYQEVKPREIYVNDRNDMFVGSSIYFSKEEAIEGIAGDAKKVRQVKFIEVLE